MSLTGISYSIDHAAHLLNMTVEGVKNRIWNGELPFFVDDSTVSEFVSPHRTRRSSARSESRK